MRLKTLIAFVCAAVAATGATRAADVPDAVQKTLTGYYALTCAAILDPSDANLDAAFAQLAPNFVETDTKGKETKRAEVVANDKQQMKTLHATSCDNALATFTSPDANTVVVINTFHMEGSIQAPDGTHDLAVTNKGQDTWTLVDGKWLNSQSKDLKILVKVDGKVVQDEGQ
jgi:hypothetical protein